MRELLEIIDAYHSLQTDAKPCALATVIAIEGSAYRRPGARMLIAEDGRTWGGVSGGCLERDVARRGREVMTTGHCQRHRYDTADDESLAIDGVNSATGCGGTIDVFIQPLSASEPGPMNAFQEVVCQRRATSLATILRAESHSFRCGSTIPMAELGDWNSVQSKMNPSEPLPKAPVWVDSSYGVIEIRQRGTERLEIFAERVLPPQAVVIVGAGPDARAVASFAKSLGWHVTIVAARPAMHVHERFAFLADRIHITGGDAPLEGVEIASDAAVVLMTHNVLRDQLALATVPRGVAYLGLLGPRHRTEHILAEIGSPRRESLASPIGLDLGAETPEEIALAIIAEIQSSLRGASGRPLSQLDGPIHASTRPPTAGDRGNVVRNSSCAS